MYYTLCPGGWWGEGGPGGSGGYGGKGGRITVVNDGANATGLIVDCAHGGQGADGELGAKGDAGAREPQRFVLAVRGNCPGKGLRKETFPSHARRSSRPWTPIRRPTARSRQPSSATRLFDDTSPSARCACSWNGCAFCSSVLVVPIPSGIRATGSRLHGTACRPAMDPGHSRHDDRPHDAAVPDVAGRDDLVSSRNVTASSTTGLRQEALDPAGLSQSGRTGRGCGKAEGSTLSLSACYGEYGDFGARTPAAGEPCSSGLVMCSSCGEPLPSVT